MGKRKKRRKSPWLIAAEYAAVLAARRLILTLPLKWAYRLAAIIGTLAYVADFRHRRRSVQHLLHAGVATTPRQARKIARANFVHLTKVGVEIIKLDQLVTQDTLKERLVEDFAPEARAAFADKTKGIILIGAHFGNWEMSGLACGAVYRPILSVMRPFDNPKVDALVRDRRSRFRQEVHDKKDALKPLLGALRRGWAVGILADQHAGTAEGVEVTFFGHPVRAHASPALLSLKTGAPLMLGLARRVGDDFRFEIILRGPFAIAPTGDKERDVKTLTQMFTSAMEEIFRQYPEQWLWSHRRWLDINR